VRADDADAAPLARRLGLRSMADAHRGRRAAPLTRRVAR